MNGNFTRVLVGLIVALFMFFMGLGVNAVLSDIERVEDGVAVNSKRVAAQQAQNEEILRRLSRIESKLDQQ